MHNEKDKTKSLWESKPRGLTLNYYAYKYENFKKYGLYPKSELHTNSILGAKCSETREVA
jgi:hypothetical protein